MLVLLGAIREALGTGALFANMHLLFGEAARSWTLTLVDHYDGFLFAILPPGAFVGLGLLIALKNVIDSRIKARREAKTATDAGPASGGKRVRVTG